MDEPEAGVALFLNVILPLLFYSVSKLVMLYISKAKEKDTHYRFMPIDFTVVNAIIYVTSILELIQHIERYFVFILYGVYVISFIFVSIVGLVSKMKRQTARALILGGIFVSTGFGSVMYDFTLSFIIPSMSFCLSEVVWLIFSDSP